jgi:hypothetical protein
MPTHASSATWLATYGTAHLHPDFGTQYGGENWGYNLNTVAASTPLVDMRSQFAYGDESDIGPPSPPYPTSGAIGYPITANAVYEGQNFGTTGLANVGSASGSDCHLFLYQPTYGLEYEIYAVSNGPGAGVSWQGGAIFDLNTNHMRPDGWTSSDAAGLAVIPILPTWEEATSGNGIHHALRMSTNHTHNTYDWPASHQAGVSATTVPNMGAWWRLNPNYDISGFSPTNQAILQALKDYGAIVADNGGTGFLQGMQNNNWNDADINNLKQLTLNDGVFIDVSSLKFAPNSYAAGTGPASVGAGAADTGTGTSASVFVQSHHRASQPRARASQ